jgi:hypothetical protein
LLSTAKCSKNIFASNQSYCWHQQERQVA